MNSPGLFGLDEKPNIIEIASSDEALKKADQMFKDGIIGTKFPPVIHRGSHDDNDEMANDIIAKKLRNLKSPIDIKGKKAIENMDSQDIKKVIEDITQELRDRYNKGNVETKKGNQLSYIEQGEGKWA